jgi:hypothetical protein
MEYIGAPFTIQNTEEHGWLVTWPDSVVHLIDQEPVESVSFTVLIPRNPNLTMEDVVSFSRKRAIEILQAAVRRPEPGGQ